MENYPISFLLLLFWAEAVDRVARRKAEEKAVVGPNNDGTGPDQIPEDIRGLYQHVGCHIIICRLHERKRVQLSWGDLLSDLEA